jgi:hypothetical protein
MEDSTPRLLKIGDALSQLANVTLLPNHKQTTANESISGRSYRMGWTRMVRFVDFLLGSGHCERAFLNDIERAHHVLMVHRVEVLPRDEDL